MADSVAMSLESSYHFEYIKISNGLAYLQCQGGIVGQRYEHSLALSYLFVMTAGFT